MVYFLREKGSGIASVGERKWYIASVGERKWYIASVGERKWFSFWERKEVV